jgi:hypothetical protein
MTAGDLVRLLFAVAFVVLIAVALGALIPGASSEREYVAGGLLFVMLGVGAGLWMLSEWRRDRG